MTEKIRDIDLVNDLRNGDGKAFSELLNRYTQKVHNLAMRITRNPEDAEEVLQDVFVTVYTKIAKFEGKSAFSSWLYRITANTAFMKLRKRKQTVAASLEDVTPAEKENIGSEKSEQSDVGFICTRHQLRAELEAAVARLSDEYRTIFVLRDIDGLSNEEVSAILNLSVPAVKSRLHRSRLMLRKKLQKFYDDYRDENKVSFGPLSEPEDQFRMAA